MAPEHLVGEVANGLRKRVAVRRIHRFSSFEAARGRAMESQNLLTVEDACAALDAIAHLELTFVGGAGRWFRCLAAALEWRITTYDALYVLLARDFDAELVTADERLHTAATGMPHPPARSLSGNDGPRPELLKGCSPGLPAMMPVAGRVARGARLGQRGAGEHSGPGPGGAAAQCASP